MKNWVTSSGYKLYEILSGRCNCFLLSVGGKNILIDTGRENKWASLKSNLDDIGVNKNSLSALILTHTHFDHAENACSVKENYNTKLIVHKSERDYINRGSSPIIKGTNSITGLVTKAAGARMYKLFKYKPVEADIFVEDKYSLKEYGFNAEIVHTPGHSIGSISIIVDNEIAIVGDAMFGVFRNSAFPPFAADPKTLVESWRKLLDSGCSLFMPAHGSANSRELLRKEYEKYRKKYLI